MRLIAIALLFCLALLSQVLVAGRTDNRGEIEASVEVPEGIASLVLVADSRWMIRNTPDDTNPDRRARTTSLDWWSVRWSPFGIDSPADLLGRLGEEHRETLVTETGWEIDSVAVRRPVGARGVIDFGEVRFPHTHAACGMEIRLVGEDGGSFTRPVIFSGYEFEPLRKRPWEVYRHVALSQRGDSVRILLAPGALRLLLSDPDGFVALQVEERWEPGEPPPDPERRKTFLVPLPKEVRRRLAEYGDRHARFEHVVRLPEKPEMPLRRPNPKEPKYWWVASPRFD